MELITSKENPRIKRLCRLLANKGERDASGLFVAEGIRLCSDALLSGVKILEVYATQDALQRYPEILPIIGAAKESVAINEAVAVKISDTKTPQGIFIICEKRDHQRPHAHVHNSRYLILASLQDPGNVGSIIRTAEAFALDGVVISADCPDIYSAKVLRASMGGVFRLRIWQAFDIISEIKALKSEGVTVYAAALAGSTMKLGESQFQGSCAVVLGNEGSGLHSDVLAQCDASIAIPMAGHADSLGVAMAAGIFGWVMKQ